MFTDVRKNEEIIDKDLQPDKSFDIVKRVLKIAERRGVLYFVDGFIKDEIYEKILEFLFKITPEELASFKTMKEFSLDHMPYVEVEWYNDEKKAQTAVLSGVALLIIDGVEGGLGIDTRTYPVRSIQEPDKDKSLRGSRDGFVETLIFNTAMIRRRIRDTSLRMEYYQVGTGSKVDVAISYLEGSVDQKLIDKLRSKLKNINISGLSMTQQALSEVLLNTNVFNPYPRIKFTERPDFASACILEGKIVLVMDNSPMVMIFPVSFFDFFKETDDYYFPAITGSYTRTLRMVVSFLTVFITPFYLYVSNNPQILPSWLEFLKIEEPINIPLLAQFLILELLIDGLRLASINTPDTLSSSLGIVGGLLLSEFAISAGWFILETILLMAFVAIASYAQPSFEMGYAMKYERIVMLIFTQIFGIWGLVGATIFFAVVKLLSKTLSGRCYLYPIVPFKFKEVIRLFVRTTIDKNH